MRGKKIGSAVLLLALTMTLCAGCGTRRLPDGVDEETAGEAGREIVTMLAAQDYQGVADAFSEEMRESYSVTAESIEEVMTNVEGAGAYVQTTQTLAVGGKSDGYDGTYVAVTVYCEHEEDDVLYEISFTPDLELIGLRVKQK